MSFKLNLSQKLLLALATVLFLAGAGKIIYYRFYPFNALLFSINNLNDSVGFEMAIEVVTRANIDYWSNESISAETVNAMLISANYRRNSYASESVHSIGPRFSQEQILVGGFYVDPEITVYTIVDDVFYRRQGSQASWNLFDGLPNVRENMEPYVRHQSTVPVEINDFNMPREMQMNNFSLTIEGEGADDPATQLMMFFDGVSPIISSYLDLLVADGSAQRIHVDFQIDDFMRLRGVQAQIHYNEFSMIIFLDITRISRDINITPPDITNGTDLDNIAEDEFDPTLRRVFDSLSGGN